MGPEIIDPQAAEKREMAQRNANLHFAGQLMLSMLSGKADIAGCANITPQELFQFAIGVAEQMNLYFSRPFDEPNRLVN